MIRAAVISMALAAPVTSASAQHVACAFTLVCAPEIECEAHEGIPFEIAYTGGVHWLEVAGEDVVGVMLRPAPDLTLGFVTDDETLLFTLSGDEGALTRHRRGPGERLTVASFLGPCVTA
jgi:hypothetical protein